MEEFNREEALRKKAEIAFRIHSESVHKANCSCFNCSLDPNAIKAREELDSSNLNNASKVYYVDGDGNECRMPKKEVKDEQ